MPLSENDAAQAAGVSKSDIRRAINKGHLPATRNDWGEYEIEAAELFRALEWVVPDPERDNEPRPNQ